MGSLPRPHHDPAYDHQYGYGMRSSAGASTRPFVDSAMDQSPLPGMGDPSFDILEWHPAYQSCQRFFLDHAQYEPGTQAVCALVNIRLPHQWLHMPITSSQPPPSSAGGGASSSYNFNAYSRSSGMHSPRARGSPLPVFVSPVPYIRRLVVTGFDKAPILHGFFGDDYVRGIMPHVECERRNYLFAAKHGGWRSCKRQYDVGSGHGGDESVPFMKPLDEAKTAELDAAEQAWSDWLAMEDWMVGPRAPEDNEDRRRPSQGGGGASLNRHDTPDALPDGYRSR